MGTYPELKRKFASFDISFLLINVERASTFVVTSHKYISIQVLSFYLKLLRVLNLYVFSFLFPDECFYYLFMYSIYAVDICVNL